MVYRMWPIGAAPGQGGGPGRSLPVLPLGGGSLIGGMINNGPAIDTPGCMLKAIGISDFVTNSAMVVTTQ